MLEESTRVPSPDTQELARKASQSRTTPLVKAIPHHFHGEKPKRRLVKQLLSFTEKHVIKTSGGKGKNLYQLANKWPVLDDAARVSAADDFRAVDALGGVSGINDQL